MSSCTPDDEITVWHLRALLDLALDALGDVDTGNWRRQEMRALAALEAADRHLSEIERRHGWEIIGDEAPPEQPAEPLGRAQP